MATLCLRIGAPWIAWHARHRFMSKTDRKSNPHGRDEVVRSVAESPLTRLPPHSKGQRENGGCDSRAIHRNNAQIGAVEERTFLCLWRLLSGRCIGTERLMKLAMSQMMDNKMVTPAEI